MPTETYNPIVREFGLVRSALMRLCDRPRNVIRPETRLEELFPVRSRYEQWQSLHREGIRMPTLEMPGKQFLCLLSIALVSATLVGVASQSWWIGVLMFVPATIFVVRCGKTLANQIPRCPATVGQLTMYHTRFRDHRDSGHKWTHSEIETKVRILFAVFAGLSLAQVRRDSNFVEDLMLD